MINSIFMTLLISVYSIFYILSYKDDIVLQVCKIVIPLLNLLSLGLIPNKQGNLMKDMIIEYGIK